MQTTGRITDLSIDFKTQNSKISLILDTRELEVIEQLKNVEKLSIDLKRYRHKRSLEANSYCWVLCDKIAKEFCKDGTVVTKEQIYQDAIKQIGTFEPMIWEEKNYERCKEIWENQGLGFLVQEVTKKDKCVKVHCYYGSSTYNTQEMSLLIELIVGLAESLGVETKSEAELNSMLESWRKMIVKDLSNSFYPLPKPKKTEKNRTVHIKKKSGRLAKLERNRYSIITDDLKHCYICKQSKWELHEIFGGRNRQASMKYGLVIPACRKCHKKIPNDETLKKNLYEVAKKEFKKHYKSENFIEIFGKNYI